MSSLFVTGLPHDEQKRTLTESSVPQEVQLDMISPLQSTAPGRLSALGCELSASGFRLSAPGSRIPYFGFRMTDA
jgi:hypothetical protein